MILNHGGIVSLAPARLRSSLGDLASLLRGKRCGASVAALYCMIRNLLRLGHFAPPRSMLAEQALTARAPDGKLNGLLRALRPASGSGATSSLAALLRGHLGRPSLPALQAAFPPQLNGRRVLIGRRCLSLIGFAGGDVGDELGELVRVTGAFA